MKIKYLLSFFILVANSYAWRANERITPWESIYSTRTTSALNVYVVNETTITVSTVKTNTSSMTISVTKGDALTYTFSALYASYDTLRDLISWGDSISTVTVVISHPSPLFAVDTTTSTQLVATSTANCLGSSNEVTLAVSNTLGFSYVKAAEQGERHYTQGFDCNATFGSGTSHMYIYDGIYASSDTLKKWEIETTATGEEMPIKGIVRGTAGNAMRFDVVGSSWISAGWMNIEGYSK